MQIGASVPVQYRKLIIREHSASELLAPKRTEIRNKRASHRLTGEAMEQGGA